MTTSTTSAEKTKVVTTTNPATDAAVREKLITARIALLLKAPFFGNLATRLKLVNADEWCGTAATDGRNFYYNSEFVKKLPQKQIEFLMGHEVLHVVYDHMGRRGDRDARLYNAAADYCVNSDLKQQRIGDFIPIGLYDKKYDGWSSEEVYDDLYANADKIDIDALMKQLLDEHLDPDDDGEDGEGGNSPSKSGNKEGEGSGRPSKMTAEEKKALRDEIREAVLHAAEAAGAGNLPAGVKRMINTLTNPQMNWRELIRQQIQSLVKSDYTWMKPSRRSWHMDAVFPGTNFAETIDVCVSIDASGSMSDAMLRDILSEVKGIMQAFDDFKLRVWSFDTDVYGMETFTPDNIDDIDYYEVQGGGGTTFEANWEFMKANEIIPKFFVMFTDGYPGNGWGDEDYCETLFVIHGTTNITAPFGQTAYYELSKEHA
jgi:predicted metal-dependent peptidase